MRCDNCFYLPFDFSPLKSIYCFALKKITSQPHQPFSNSKKKKKKHHQPFPPPKHTPSTYFDLPSQSLFSAFIAFQANSFVTFPSTHHFSYIHSFFSFSSYMYMYIDLFQASQFTLGRDPTSISLFNII